MDVFIYAIKICVLLINLFYFSKANTITFYNFINISTELREKKNSLLINVFECEISEKNLFLLVHKKKS